MSAEIESHGGFLGGQNKAGENDGGKEKATARFSRKRHEKTLGETDGRSGGNERNGV